MWQKLRQKTQGLEIIGCGLLTQPTGDQLPHTWVLGLGLCPTACTAELTMSHHKLATLSRRQKPMLPGGQYFSMLLARRQSLQFYNEFIKW